MLFSTHTYIIVSIVFSTYVCKKSLADGLYACVNRHPHNAFIRIFLIVYEKKWCGKEVYVLMLHLVKNFVNIWSLVKQFRSVEKHFCRKHLCSWQALKAEEMIGKRRGKKDRGRMKRRGGEEEAEGPKWSEALVNTLSLHSTQWIAYWPKNVSALPIERITDKWLLPQEISRARFYS